MNQSLKRFVLLIILANWFILLLAQEINTKEFIRSVQNADLSFYYDEDYEKAASLYEPLLKAHPDNSNLAAKLGICYLNIDGKKKDALRLLSQAAANVAAKDKDYTETGIKAPPDTYLYLALAYHMNDSLEKAVSLYNDAKKRLDKTEIFRAAYLDKQIQDCMFAMEMKKKPMTVFRNYLFPGRQNNPGLAIQLSH